ncbi:MAG: AAA family ATPase [Termitinemataceae bacterium]|nr:MAG: AAA family ATPase [Termitinemataceae bacterium]
MEKDNLIKNSPVRVLEKKIGGTLAAGEIGVIASLSGIGKTSVMVQIALDKLLQGEKVIHVSFNQHSDYILSWYQNMFDEVIKKRSVENESDIKDDLIRNRVIMNFNQEGVNSDVIRSSLKAMIVEGGYKAHSIIIDGFDFSIAARERISTFKAFAKEVGLSVWYSCSIKNQKDIDKNGIPSVLKDFEDLMEVVISLEAKSGWTELAVVKNRDKYKPANSELKLDPRTLLILE